MRACNLKHSDGSCLRPPTGSPLVNLPFTPGQEDDERQRLTALHSYAILDTPPEASYDDLARLAALICDTPIALISLIDADRQWFKARFGLSRSETSRDDSFCTHAIRQKDQVLVVPDATVDPRFAKSPLVTHEPHVRFYAGAPLVAPGGEALGALCVIDRRARDLSPEQVRALETLATQVVAQFELRRHQTLLSLLEHEQKAGRELARNNRALQMMSACNEALVMAKDEASLLARVCEIAVEAGRHVMAWVGYAQDDEPKSIQPMAQQGDESGYLQEIKLTWIEGASGRGVGPAGRCIREGVTIACRDIQDPSSGFHYTEAAKRRGFRSVVCLPLKDTHRTYGLLALYSGEVEDLAEDEVRLLENLASDLAYGIGAIRDRIVRHRAEEALLASLREKEALLKEVHHRVKNNLQVIMSLLRIEGRRIDHEITKTVLDQMQGRIQSMALLHETLYRSGNFARVDLAAYLGQLAQQVFRSQMAQPGLVQLHLDLQPVQMDIDQAIPCGLIVNELVSNSLKHAFAEGRSGQVWIGLHPGPGGAGHTLSVRDNGPGLPPDFDLKRTRSLGLQLVSDLARQLEGSLTVGPGPGAHFEVTFHRTRMATVEIPPYLRTPSKPRE